MLRSGGGGLYYEPPCIGEKGPPSFVIRMGEHEGGLTDRYSTFVPMEIGIVGMSPGSSILRSGDSSSFLQQ